MKSKKSKIWYVYGVRCSDSTLYIGITNNLKARIEKHNKGTGAKYTRSRRPVKLLRSEKCPDIGSAMRRERKLKKIGKVKKELWVRGEKISPRVAKKNKTKSISANQSISRKSIRESATKTENGKSFNRELTRMNTNKKIERIGSKVKTHKNTKNAKKRKAA
ncbi:MAG: GIY-YIG nuclease family protein [bacterium]|nr:GIY-YIG nuclease family protein [bacterium]